MLQNEYPIWSRFAEYSDENGVKIMKKSFGIFGIVVLLLCISMLASCGGEEPKTEQSAQTGTQQQIAQPMDADAVFQSLLNDVTYACELQDQGENAEFYFSDLPEGTEISMYCASGTNSDHAILFKAKDAGSTEAVAASARVYLDELKTQAGLYSPEETAKLDKAVVYTKDNFVFVCVTDDIDTVNRILEG